MKAIKRLKKPLSIVAAALAIVATQAAAAQAVATAMAGVSVTPTNPSTSATAVTYSWLATDYQTTAAVKCVKVQFSTTATGSTFPTGMAATGLTFGGTLLTGQTFTADNTSAGAGTTVYNNSTGVTPTGSGKTITLAGITNPSSSGSIYMRVTTYDAVGTGSSGACTGTILDTETAAVVAVTDNTTVSVTVDPSFTFTVAGKASACNGEANNLSSAGSPTAVALGHLAVSSNVSGAQTLSVSGNSGGGFTVYTKGTQATTNLRNVAHPWADVAGSYAVPAALGSGERFGYTYADTTASSSVAAVTSNNFIALDNTNRAIMGSSSSMSGSGCIGFDAQTGASTPAGSYSATVSYTAVPVF